MREKATRSAQRKPIEKSRVCLPVSFGQILGNRDRSIRQEALAVWPEGKLRNSPAATPEAVRVSRRDVSGLHQGMKYALGSEAMSRIRGRPRGS